MSVTEDAPAAGDTLKFEPCPPITNIDLGETAIDAMTKLGAEAAGVTIVAVEAPEGASGLPKAIPVGIVHGENPRAESLHGLFEPWRTKPKDKCGTATALTLGALVDLVNRHATRHSAIFADTDWQKPSITAVIDYHEIAAGEAAGEVTPGEPDNLRHRIRYAFPLSDEWKAWIAMDGKPMPQDVFAAFVEDRIADLSSPMDNERAEWERLFGTTIATPSALMNVSRGLAVNVESKVKNITTLQSGEIQLQWEEVHKDSDGKPIKVPGMFVLSIAPFFGGDLCRIPVRLRYRVMSGDIKWFYQIYRPDQFITERIRDDLVIVRRDTGLPVYEGAPEA